jgi:uncharacterized protein (TIGR04255 family)
MQGTVRPPVKFERPPIVEVTCGVIFALPKPLRTAHVGLYWSRIKNEFPRTEDADTLAPTFENPEPGGVTQIMQWEFVQLAPLRRTWLVNEPGDRLIQIQEDRFHYNWKRAEQKPGYPSYQDVIAGFHSQWSDFSRFLGEEELGEPVVRQLEMTYFNIFPSESDYLVDHQRSGAQTRYLPRPESVNLRSVYFVDVLRGRLHATAQTARDVQTGEKVIRLEITARGLPKEVTSASCREWFDAAHDWITHGFADMTTEQAHSIWGRTS